MSIKGPFKSWRDYLFLALIGQAFFGAFPALLHYLTTVKVVASGNRWSRQAFVLKNFNLTSF